MNATQLKNIINSKVKQRSTTAQELYDLYFFEQLLKRLAISKYANNYVLKGGFLLENIVGIEQRTTLDLDFSYQQKTLNDDSLKSEIKEILNIDINDNIIYTVIDISSISDRDKYDGYQVKVKAKLENLTKTFSIDIAQGDQITPDPVLYDYKSTIVDNDSFTISAYNIETILAEKFETLIARETNNSRMKDFYDIHILSNIKSLNPDLFHTAFINTCEHRNIDYRKANVYEKMMKVIKSELINERFDRYRNKHKYTKDVSFKLVTESILKVYSLIKYIDEQIIKLKRLVFMRHGEDDSLKMGGWSDSVLTEKGKRQVAMASEQLKHDFIGDAILISSDLLRAKQTADIVCQILNLNSIFDENYREINNGLLSKLSKHEFFKQCPEVYFSSLEMDEEYPNGESPKQFYQRIKTALVDLNRKYEDRTVLLISHGGVYGVIKSIVYGVAWSNKQKYVINHAQIIDLSL